jgi:hypothetical protein
VVLAIFITSITRTLAPAARDSHGLRNSVIG